MLRFVVSITLAPSLTVSSLWRPPVWQWDWERVVSMTEDGKWLGNLSIATSLTVRVWSLLNIILLWSWQGYFQQKHAMLPKDRLDYQLLLLLISRFQSHYHKKFEFSTCWVILQSSGHPFVTWSLSIQSLWNLSRDGKGWTGFCYFLQTQAFLCMEGAETSHQQQLSPCLQINCILECQK